MNKFNVGDKVKILGNMRYTGIEGFIESIDFSDESLTRYNIKKYDSSIIPLPISENILKKMEINEFEKVMFTNEYDEAFMEMAGRLPIDPSGKCNLIVAVGANERNIAHFHVFRKEEDKKSWKNGACLYYTENKYYDHKDNDKTLTKDELKELIDLLKKPYKRNKSITNWQQLVYYWNDNNELYEIPDNTPIPDYNYDTITRYKEK